jgi:hypothetical protein
MPIDFDSIRCLLIIMGVMTVTPGLAWAAENKVIAINVALEPDAATADFAKTVNAEMLKSYPQGFALDGTHVPHITILQRYVRTASLNAVFTAVDQALATAFVSSWRLKTSNYNFNPWGDGFLGSIVLEQNGELLLLQQNLIEAIAPYSEPNGFSESFYYTQNEPEISQVTIDYVTTFVPERVGKNYLPHLTIGFASAKQRQIMIEKPFKPLIFSPAAVAIYQIGNYGTARKKLKEWRRQ